jgi:hypothetical protein
MALSNAPLISSPDYNHDYILYISASAVSVAGVLVQIGDDDREHVIYYISKNLSGPPLKYNHEEKLALAVFLAVQKLCHYILLRTTTVIADSNPMQYLLSRWQINSKFAGWIIILQEYDLEFSTPKRKKSLILAKLVTAFPVLYIKTVPGTFFILSPRGAIFPYPIQVRMLMFKIIK